MVKAKKKAVLTLEERLEQALVPEAEQPYPVPENWCWTRLGTLINTSKEKKDIFSDEGERYVGLEHMEKNGGIIAYSSAGGIKSLKNVFHPKQILYGKLRPYLNKHDIATFDGICSTDILVFATTQASNPNFINFFFSQSEFLEYVVANSKGINLPRVSEDTILQAVCPLPPLSEQQRIVDRIESLFAKLDEAREKAQAALDSFETRKAAILHKAFTGELTAKWREENGVGMDSWKYKQLGKCGRWVGGGTPSKSQLNYWENGSIPWISPKDMKSNIIEDTIDHITSDAIKESSTNLISSPAIIFVMRSGILRRILPIAMTKIPVTLNQDMKAMIPEEINQEYMFWVCTANERMIRESCAKSGTTVESINAAALFKFIIPIASKSEQTEIVRLLDAFFTKEQKAKELCSVLDKIDLIKKSILARAFRGELDTNDPTEESALELLKSIV